jgi:membrane carboxypeptidase/penicillin-binding protein
MTESTRAGSRGPDRTSEELAGTLREKARNAATAALREGLEEIDERHGQRVADEVATLIDVAEVFAGLADRDARVPASTGRDASVSASAERNTTRTKARPKDDDEPWEFKPLSRS